MSANASAPSGSSLYLKPVLFCVLFTIGLYVFSTAVNWFPPQYERIIYGIAGTLAGLLSGFVFLRFDGKRFADINLVFRSSSPGNFSKGFVAGVLLMGLLAMLTLKLTHSTLRLNNSVSAGSFLLAALPLLPLAFMEELGFRAYPVEFMRGRVDFRIILLLTSVLFALYHIVSGWPVGIAFYGPGIWGLIYGLAALYGKGIAMSTGLHFACNLTTTALGSSGSAVSIWIVETPDRPPLVSGIWLDLLPAGVLFVIAIVLIEWYRSGISKKCEFAGGK